MVIGELFDRAMAEKLRDELFKRGIHSHIKELESLAPDLVSVETVYQLVVVDTIKAKEAEEYFRIRMGLPGGRREPDPEWEKIRALKMGVVTKFLLGFSLLIFIVKYIRPEAFESLARGLFFNDPDKGFMESIFAGEVWRVITPIFLHFNFLHILFNGMWIKDLGAVFEAEKGSKRFIIFVLVVSITSNFLQYLAMGPRFGGLSGLVYGLLGYLWVYGSVHKSAQFRLPKRDIMIIVGWYFLCLTGWIGPIANVAHGVGLGVGMLWGLFPFNKESGIENIAMARLKYIAMAIFFTIGTFVIELRELFL